MRFSSGCSDYTPRVGTGPIVIALLLCLAQREAGTIVTRLAYGADRLLAMGHSLTAPTRGLGYYCVYMRGISTTHSFMSLCPSGASVTVRELWNHPFNHTQPFIYPHLYAQRGASSLSLCFTVLPFIHSSIHSVKVQK